MKILHTSDWHLGRKLGDFDLREEQRHLLTKELPRVVKEEGVDLVVIAGDVYDRRLPPNEAVHILNDVLTSLRDFDVPVLMIGGNHDTSDILDYMSTVLGRLGIHVYGKFRWPIEPLIFRDEHGEVAVFPIPFFEPEDLPPEPFGRDERFKSVGEAFGAIMEKVKEVAEDRRTVVVAHAYVTGARYAKSEVELEVGGLAPVPTAVFDGIDYVALGHIHSHQSLSSTLHYSGAIYPYAIDELTRESDGETILHKGVLVVEIGPKGASPSVKFRELTPLRPAVALRGTLSELLKIGRSRKYENSLVLLEVVDGSVEDKKWARLDSFYPNLLQKRILRTSGSRPQTVMELDETFVKARTPRERILAYYTKALGEWFDAERKRHLESILDRAEARLRAGEEA